MRILQIVSGTELNGAVRYAAVVSRLLARRGHDVILLARPWLDLSSILSDMAGVEIATSTLRRRPGEVRRIGAFCRARGIQVIHTHASSGHAFGALQRLFYRVPCVATAHKLNLQLHWRMNDRVICHNEEARRYQRIVNWVPARRLRIVPAFVDPGYLSVGAEDRSVTRSRLGIAEDRLVLTTVGHIIPRKGLLDIVEALPSVLEAHGTACLLVVGASVDPAYRERAMARARALGVADRIIWLEGLSDSDMAHALRASDLYVQASHVETGPLVVLEAMALGLPAVGTRCGAMPEFIVPGTTGELVPIGQPAALAAAIAGILKDRARMSAMGIAGQERFAAQFTAAANIPKIEAILAEAAGVSPDR